MATEVKVVVSVDFCACNSQVITQSKNRRFVERYDPTIEYSYRKQVKVGSTDVLLAMLDTACHDEYSAMWDQYYRTADVVIIVYSVTDQLSFTNVRQYHDHIRRVKGSDSVPFILIGTKIIKRDTRVRVIEPGKPSSKAVERKSPVTFNNGLKMASDIKAQGFFECSAKTGGGIRDVYHRAAEVILQYVQNKVLTEILKQGTEENYDIRVMLVGRAAVGKTTLTRRLLGLPVNLKNYKSTNGVDVHIHSCDIQLDFGTWVIKDKEKSLKKTLMNLWEKRIKSHEETAMKTKSTGYRDFHLRCAKVLQKIQASDFEDLKEAPTIFSSKSASNSGIFLHMRETSDDEDETSDDEDETSDEEGQTLLKTLDTEYPSDRCLRSVLSKPARSTEPIHKTVDNTDVQQTLQQAKGLPKEKADHYAKVSLYDFAGQYIFHASHPTFLSPQAIYILVFDLSKLIEWKGKKRKIKKSLHDDEEQYFGDCRGHSALGERESIFFWLNVIYLFAALKQNIKPQVILVGTHYDKLPKFERKKLIEKFLRELRCELATSPLKELVSYDFVVDNSKKEDDSFTAIKAEIFRLAKLQPDWGKKTPSKWLPLERELQCLKELGLKVLSLDELSDINGGLDLQIDTDAEMEMFLQYLHDTGEIIFFSDPQLRDYIVLDPVWLIDALKLVITSDRFAVRIPKLAENWIDFYKTGVIYRSTIVGIFEKRTKDPALYENHEHVLRLMEKFLFIAAPIEFPEEIAENNSMEEEIDTSYNMKDTSYIMPCMIHKEIDTQLITNIEGTCRTSVLCLVSINNFLPPAIFQKLLSMCIKKWPIVEQHGQKLIFCGVCKFNLDSSRNYKLTVFHVGYAIHARITSYSKDDIVPHIVCGLVFQFLVHCLKSVLKGMGFSDKFRTCVQCPGFSPLENGGYIDTDIARNQDSVTCDDCAISHSLQSKEILRSWIRMQSAEQSLNGETKELEHASVIDGASLGSEICGENMSGAVGGVPLDPVAIDADSASVVSDDEGNSETDFQPYQSYQKLEIGPVKALPKPTTSPEVKDIYRRVLNKNLTKLKNGLTPCTIDSIIEAEIGSAGHHIDIKDLKDKTRERNEKIVDLIMKQGFEEGYKKLKVILWETKQISLLKDLEETEKELLEEEKMKAAEEAMEQLSTAINQNL